MRLLLFLLKCIVGLLASIGLIALVIALVLGFAWQQIEDWQQPDEELPENAVLLLDLGEGLVDGPPEGTGVLAGLTGEINLRRLVLGLEAAAADPAVGGLMLELGSGQLDMARAQEMRQAIVDFKRSGKPVQAFAASFGEGGDGTLHYYLASVADRITLQPSGNLDLIGFTLDQPYARRLLDAWGVEPRIYRREEYKGAAGPVMFEEMSAPVRRNLQQLLDSWFTQLAGDIAKDRGLAVPEVRTTIDEGPYLPAEALNLKLVDRLAYRDEARSEVLEAAGARAELVPLQSYLASRFEARDDEAPRQRIAVVYGLGPVVLGKSEEGGPLGGITMGSDTIAEAFAEAAADPEVRAILFRVDSPGGSYAASDAIWRAVRQAQEAGKPVVVSMGSLAASGGYFVAASADRIVAAPGTVTGSIGVVSGKLLTRGLWEELGVNWSGVQAGANAGFWRWTEDFTPEQWARFKRFVDVAYEDFVGKVSSGRKLSFEDAQAVAGGRIWTGSDALEHGLVDGLGGYRAAIDTAKTLAGIPVTDPVLLVDYPEREDRLQDVLRRLVLDNLLAARFAGLLRQFGLVEPLAAAGRQGALLMEDPRARLLRAVE